MLAFAHFSVLEQGSTCGSNTALVSENYCMNFLAPTYKSPGWKSDTYRENDFIFTLQTRHSNFLSDYLLLESLFSCIQSVPCLLFDFAENRGMDLGSGKSIDKARNELFNFLGHKVTSFQMSVSSQ